MKKRMNKFKKGLIVAGLTAGAVTGVTAVRNAIDELDNPHDMVPNDEVATLDTITDSKLEATGMTQEQLNKYNEYKEILENTDKTEELKKLPKEIYNLGLDIFKSKVAHNTGVSKDEIGIDVSHNLADKLEIKVKIKDKEYKYFDEKGLEAIITDSELSDKVAAYAISMAEIDTIVDKQRNSMVVTDEEIKEESKNALNSIEGIIPDMIEVGESSIVAKTMPEKKPLYKTEFEDVSYEENKDYKLTIEKALEEDEMER